MTTVSSKMLLGGEIMNNVKLYRKQIRMTRKALAAQTGLSMSYVYFIETGERNPTIAVACKIAQALQQPLDVLFPPDVLTK